MDLVDAPDDAGLAEAGCGLVDRAPRDEATSVRLASDTVRLKGGRALLRIRCLPAAPCAGTATVGGRSARYRIAGSATRTVRARVARGARRLTVALAEQGAAGPRTLRARLATRR